MRLIPLCLTAVAITGMHTLVHAGCNCDDWINRDGYCVDYVKSKIPSFPEPRNIAQIEALNNREIPEVEEGDVAIFDLGNYWHVAYVEKVHEDRQGKATAIDVSEMNFGGQLSFEEYRNKWSPKSESEWKRALCCGVTDTYDQTSSRKNVPLNSVTQIWTPDPAEPGGSIWRRGSHLLGKAREVLNRILQVAGREI